MTANLICFRTPSIVLLLVITVLFSSVGCTVHLSCTRLVAYMSSTHNSTLAGGVHAALH